MTQWQPSPTGVFLNPFLSFSLLIYELINRSIDQSVNQSISQSVSQSICSINQSICSKNRHYTSILCNNLYLVREGSFNPVCMQIFWLIILNWNDRSPYNNNVMFNMHNRKYPGIISVFSPRNPYSHCVVGV